MGCIKSSAPLVIQNIDKIKRNEIEQNRLISTYVSSSQCGQSEALSKVSSGRSSKKSKSSSSSSDSNKESLSDKKKIKLN